MLEDRSYMQEPSYRSGLSATAKLMIVMVAVFMLQTINWVYIHSSFDAVWLALTADKVVHGAIWQLLTYQFLHGAWWHLAGNMLGLWLCGRFVEGVYGARKMVWFFLLCGLGGGVLHVLFGLLMPVPWGREVVGASAGTMGLLAAFCLMEPDAMVLVMFVLPVRTRYFLIFILAISAFFTIVPADRSVAHPAHLGGLLTGMAIVRYGFPKLPAFLQFGGRSRGGRSRAGAPSWMVQSDDATPRPGSGQDFISTEVDPILEKISTHGIHSLTERERKILEAARSRMNRR